MGLESGTYINDLVATNPTTTDKRRQGDDHLRFIKAAILATFPNIAGAITASHTELNFMDGVTSAVQDQLDGKLSADSADGAGLVESGGVLAVGEGAGIDVAADAVALDISDLTAMLANSLVGTDGFLVDDGGVMKRMAYNAAGVPVTTESTTGRTIAAADLNRYIRCTNSSAVTITLNTSIGAVGNWLIIEQAGTGTVSFAGTSTRNAANGTGTARRYSVMLAFCTAANTWTIFGDTA